MKKVSVKFSTTTDNINAFYVSKLDNLPEETLVNIHSILQENIRNGNIWLRHYCMVEGEAHLVYILDSEDAVTEVQPALDILETQEGHIETVVEDMTFEQFADFAGSHDETEIQHERKIALNQQSN